MPFILRIFFVFFLSILSLFSAENLEVKENKRFAVIDIPVNGKNEIFLLEKRGEEYIAIKNLSKGFAGFNYDPYLFFQKSSPSVIWVNRNRDVQSLILYLDEKFRQYFLNFPFELSKPLIERDRKGRLLLLLPSPNGVFYSFVKENNLIFNKAFPFPSYFLCEKKDEWNIIWILWSGFEGGDWEIYLTKWDGETFSPVERLTDNDAQDIEPSISLDPFNIFWKSYKNGKFYLESLNGFSEKRNLDIELFEMDFNSFIAFGDSITYGMVDYKPEAEGYVPRLERLLKEEFSEKVKVLNRGIPGEETPGGLSRIRSVIESDPSRYILIMEGTNDVTRGYPAWFTAKNLEEMVKISISYGMKPLIANLIPKTSFAEYLNWRIEEVNKLIPKIAENHKIPFVDHYNAFMSYPEEKGGWRALYSGHNHPNEEGYQLMAETWFKAISKLPRFKEKDQPIEYEKFRKIKHKFGVLR